MATEVSFKVNRLDFDTIAKIADRAVQIGREKNRPFGCQQVTMDVTACHANGNPLRLQALLDADDFNFLHDIVGIERHLNRDTGKLMNHFSPRFSRRVRSAA